MYTTTYVYFICFLKKKKIFCEILYGGYLVLRNVNKSSVQEENKNSSRNSQSCLTATSLKKLPH